MISALDASAQTPVELTAAFIRPSEVGASLKLLTSIPIFVCVPRRLSTVLGKPSLVLGAKPEVSDWNKLTESKHTAISPLISIGFRKN